MELAIGVQTALITAFLIRKYPRSSRMEEWKIGRLEEWKGGRVEGWGRTWRIPAVVLCASF